MAGPAEKLCKKRRADARRFLWSAASLARPKGNVSPGIWPSLAALLLSPGLLISTAFAGNQLRFSSIPHGAQDCVFSRTTICLATPRFRRRHRISSTCALFGKSPGSLYFARSTSWRLSWAAHFRLPRDQAAGAFMVLICSRRESNPHLSVPKAIPDIEGFKFSFWSNENDEPIHIHVFKGGAAAKFWIQSEIRLGWNKGHAPSAPNGRVRLRLSLAARRPWKDHSDLIRCHPT